MLQELGQGVGGSRMTEPAGVVVPLEYLGTYWHRNIELSFCVAFRDGQVDSGL